MQDGARRSGIDFFAHLFRTNLRVVKRTRGLFGGPTLVPQLDRDASLVRQLLREMPHVARPIPFFPIHMKRKPHDEARDPFRARERRKLCEEQTWIPTGEITPWMGQTPKLVVNGNPHPGLAQVERDGASTKSHTPS